MSPPEAIAPSPDASERAGRRELARTIRRRRDVFTRGLQLPATADRAAQEALLSDLVDGLAAAVDLGSPDAFVHHACATAEIVEARGVSGTTFGAALAAVRSRAGASEEQLVRACVDAARLAVEARHFEAPEDPAPRGPLAEHVASFVEIALDGQWQGAESLVRRLLADGHELIDLYADLFTEALHEIGRRWARAEITVADQHVASAVACSVLSRIYAKFRPAAAHRGAAVVACAPTEAHQTSARVVADALELSGWDVHFLGTNSSAIAETVEASEASVVALSASLVATAARAAHVIEELRARFGAECPRIVVGGGPFAAVPDLWRAAGADGFAPDVRGAAAAARGPGA